MAEAESPKPQKFQSIRHRARVIEAALLLLLAKALVKRVPFRWWHGSLGRPAQNEHMPTAENPLAERRTERNLTIAIDRACAWLPFEFVCLPRAAAMQWMLRWRGLDSTLVFGVVPGEVSDDERYKFHAWVERGGHVLVGWDPDHDYRRFGALTQN